jgi:zinc protease
MRKFRFPFLSATLVLLNSFATVLAADSPASWPQVKFEKYKLPNGLEVILSEDHRLPLVAVNLWYHVGPMFEKPGRTGFAHLYSTNT